MKLKFTQLAKVFLLSSFVSSQFQIVGAQEQVYRFNEGNPAEGLRIVKQDVGGVSLAFSINKFSTVARVEKEATVYNLSAPGMILQNVEGYPDLPGTKHYIAFPQNAKPVLKIVSFEKETVQNIDISPAPVIPLATDDKPLSYEKNMSVYNKNEFFPDAPVKLLEQTKLRGVDVVSVGVSPFQYNPVTRELLVYKNIKVEITFEGGNGQFGDVSYRSRYWEPILSDHILNYNQLPTVDFNSLIRSQSLKLAADTGCEYAIIIPNGPEFLQWADSIRKFRREQGILTKIYNLNDVGGTTETDIQSFVSDAYNNWPIKPAAMLILADYGTNPMSSVIAHKYQHISSYPDFASDNFYADVTGDDLPDIAFSRIVANTAAQLQVMCSKFLNYERNPPMDAAFYNKPITAMGWQDDRWFQICAETVSGFLKGIGKNPVRANSHGSPANNTGNNVPNTGTWSTNSSTTTALNYFGPTGLNYIPTQPGTLGGFNGATSTTVNNAINAGAFLLLHRDHGYYTGWGDPSYSNTSINSVTTINNKLPFLLSINCQTGAFHHTSECFVEKFHRYTKNGQNSGVLGAIGDAEVSYSFVNDCMVWGMFDNMWPNFMPAYGTNPPSMERDKRPAFANVSAKYYLSQSSWVGTSTKQITYQLYHMFGDAFQWFFSEVPKNLTVQHNNWVSSSDVSFTVTADAGSFISLTIPGSQGPKILGTATGTGAPIAIPLFAPATANLLVTVTKQDYLRNKSTVLLGPTSVNNLALNNSGLDCYPNPFNQSTSISFSLVSTENVKLSVVDMQGKAVMIILDNVSKAAGDHQIQFNGKDLPKGVYSLVLKTDSQVATKNMVIEE